MNLKYRILLGIFLFVFFCCIAAFIAWCCGFNFDQRGSEVGFHVAMTLLASSTFAVMITNIIDL
jgi:hypothetical protein